MPVDLNVELRLAYLKAAQAAQEAEQDKIRSYRDFYDGTQAIELTDRQKEYLKADFDSFGNICKRVVQIPKERLEITMDGITPADKGQTAYADAVSMWWKVNRLGQEQKDIYETALRDSASSVVVGWDERRNVPTFTLNTIYDGQSGLIKFHYDDSGHLTFASKRWNLWNPLTPGETGKRRLTVYRTGLIERYEADPKQPDGWRFLAPPEIGGLPNPQLWTSDGTVAGEPLDIPVIPFENPGGSELADVLNIQELFNHSLASFDFAIDFHGFPLLWFVNAVLERDEDTGNGKFPGFGPGKIVNMDEGGAAGRIEAADLEKMFESGVMSWIELLAIIKGWPVSIFSNQGGAGLSGIALQILEGSLVKQVEDKQAVFADSWSKAFDVARQIAATQPGNDVPLEGEIEFAWESAATADDDRQIDNLAKRFTAGEVPIITRWRELGYTEDDIEQMIEDKRKEDELGLSDAVTGIEQ